MSKSFLSKLVIAFITILFISIQSSCGKETTSNLYHRWSFNDGTEEYFTFQSNGQVFFDSPRVEGGHASGTFTRNGNQITIVYTGAFVDGVNNTLYHKARVTHNMDILSNTTQQLKLQRIFSIIDYTSPSLTDVTRNAPVVWDLVRIN